MEERKTNYKDIVIVVLAIILVILIVLLVIKLRNSKEKENIVETEEYNTFSLSECVKGSCNKEFNFNGNVLTVVKKEDKSCEVKYNDYVIFTTSEKPLLGDNIYSFKDTVLFTTKDDDNLLSIFKYSIGNSKPEIIKLPEDNWFINKINVENEKVTIYTSRFMEGKGFLDYKNEAFVNIVKCFDFNEFKDRIAEQTFEFSYSDGKFTDIKSIGTKKLSEFSEYSKLCANGGE